MGFERSGFAIVKFVCAILALSASACTVGDRKLALPNPSENHPGHKLGFVAVFSGEMPPAIDQTGRHAWVIAHVPGNEHFTRCEWLGSGTCSASDDPFSYFGHGKVIMSGYFETDRAEQVVACMKENAPTHDVDHPGYLPIPGPNSNTFVDMLLRRCDIHVDLPTTAVGKDYRGIVGVSKTSGGTGVQLETFVLGLRLGLKEGVEVHLLGLGLGVDIWPPAILVPANPGRIGFADR